MRKTHAEDSRNIQSTDSAHKARFEYRAAILGTCITPLSPGGTHTRLDRPALDLPRTGKRLSWVDRQVFSSLRALWMLQEDVKSAKYPTPTLDSNAVRSYGQMVYNSGLIPLQTPDAELVLDARSRGRLPRFLGTDPEPRPGLSESSSHVPNSFPLPFNLFLQNNVTPSGSAYSSFLSEPKLRSTVVDALGPEKANSLFKGDVSVIATCGSGMTAVVLWLGLQLLGVKQVSLYDEILLDNVFEGVDSTIGRPFRYSPEQNIENINKQNSHQDFAIQWRCCGDHAKTREAPIAQREESRWEVLAHPDTPQEP
ncbi:hypothetical protein DFH08DRAFT_800660 [Mycena albidolilacea]|uniref:Rhodanese domain-containing protein n=1 Tax=Mycena albidolilacea TaxID=1033008 RepID=A0AAD7AKI6_9AGAR|nr:hypothetical protein DFH08DRAFT_800660 [Mycena albidolilacea]